jgi:hypothetical protein
VISKSVLGVKVFFSYCDSFDKPVAVRGSVVKLLPYDLEVVSSSPARTGCVKPKT